MTTAKAIIVGSIILAVSIFIAAQRIAYVQSYEGQWASCVDTFSSEKFKASIPAPNAATACFVMFKKGN